MGNPSWSIELIAGGTETQTDLHFGRNCNEHQSTDMRRLTTGILTEKCVIRRFRRCANVYLHKPR